MKINGKVSRMIAALVAIALSGIAFANHEQGHDKGQGPGPKVSLDITNLCQFGDGSEGNEIPDNVLRVTTTVEDVSDDPRRPVDVESVTVTGMQLIQPEKPPRKKIWKPVGYTKLVSKENDGDYKLVVVHEVDICQQPLLEKGAAALNAHVQVYLPDGQNFMRVCDNPELPGDDLDGDGDDDVDQSRIDLDEMVYRPDC